MGEREVVPGMVEEEVVVVRKRCLTVSHTKSHFYLFVFGSTMFLFISICVHIVIPQ